MVRDASHLEIESRRVIKLLLRQHLKDVFQENHGVVARGNPLRYKPAHMLALLFKLISDRAWTAAAVVVQNAKILNFDIGTVSEHGYNMLHILAESVIRSDKSNIWAVPRQSFPSGDAEYATWLQNQTEGISVFCGAIRAHGRQVYEGMLRGQNDEEKTPLQILKPAASPGRSRQHAGAVGIPAKFSYSDADTKILRYYLGFRK